MLIILKKNTFTTTCRIVFSQMTSWYILVKLTPKINHHNVKISNRWVGSCDRPPLRCCPMILASCHTWSRLTLSLWMWAGLTGSLPLHRLLLTWWDVTERLWFSCWMPSLLFLHVIYEGFQLLFCELLSGEAFVEWNWCFQSTASEDGIPINVSELGSWTSSSEV